MKKIGKSVLYLSTKNGNPRNGESTFIRCKDDSIMMMFTEYCSTGNEDEAPAHLSICRSFDEGETWTKPELIIDRDKEAQNIMSPSLIRLSNGNIGCCYLRKERTVNGGVNCMPVYRFSEDEGKTWSKMVYCTKKNGYYCGINDGAIVTREGRIIYPVSFSGYEYGGKNHHMVQGETWFFYSDDQGKTWGELTKITAPYPTPTGLQEPGVYEMEDGTLWTWARTSYGFQYDSYSHDKGLTWDTIKPNFLFSSPDSPMRVKKVGKYLVAVFNPTPFSCMSKKTEEWKSGKRTPLVVALSEDDGRSFDTSKKDLGNGRLMADIEKMYLIEDDPDNSFCYPGIIETKDGFLVTYYDSADSTYCLNWTKVTKIYYNEL